MDLHNALRPKTLDEVIGQEAAVNSLRQLHDKGELPHFILFTGGSGVGKTTLGRIIGRELLNVQERNLIEVDAASQTTLDATKALMETVKRRGLQKNAKKLVIIDECHSLSPKAWESLLKDCENPPEHLYIVLCTTEVNKVPKTIRTRAHDYHLKDIGLDDLIDFVMLSAEQSDIEISEKVAIKIARKAAGSARMALNLLSKVRDTTDNEDIADLLEDGTSLSPEFIKPMRYLCTDGKANFGGAMDLIVPLIVEGNAPEGIRLALINYAAKMLRNPKTYKSARAVQLLAVIDNFKDPMVGSDAEAKLYNAIGQLLYDE